MQEIWKDIKGYEGLYQVSNLGNIKSLSRITSGKKYGIHKLKEKILRPSKCNKYYQVFLRKNNKTKVYYVHRLVGEAFIINLNNCSDINHKDGNTHNNNIKNLEWCTRSENIKHSYRVLNRKVNINNLLKRNRMVNQYDLNGNFIKTWKSIKEASIFLNRKNIQSIYSCCKHKNGQKTAYGYRWEYANNLDRKENKL